MQNMMYSFFNPQYHREQMMNAYNQYMNALYPSQQQTISNNLPQGYSIFPVSNIDEANATKADLNYNPIFFFNQSKSEIYLKQLDRSTNAATLRIFKEVQPSQEPTSPVKNNQVINDYSLQLNTILEGINSLHRILSSLSQPQINSEIIEADIVEEKTKGGKSAK